MGKEPFIRIPDLVLCMSDAMDFIDPAVVSHHKQVAYIASCIGEGLGMNGDDRKDLLIAGALHDVGSFSLKERRKSLRFEYENPDVHAQFGYLLLRLFKPLSAIARIVRYHHRPWNNGSGSTIGKEDVPISSHILHLADRIAIQVDRKKEVLGQARTTVDRIRRNRGKQFHPELVDVFLHLADREYFWLDLVSPSIETILSHKLKFAGVGINSEDMQGFSRLFSRIIDFKSPFTATHSSGVSVSSELLAGFFGLSESECRSMRIAGYLHDLGKLAVPVEILDKPRRLRKTEMDVVRHHSFYTYRILQRVPSLQTINTWASYHHERLDGTGYPFHLSAGELPLGSQVMAVADVFTAITEDRPYRKGMKKTSALNVLRNMAARSALNGDIVKVLGTNYDEINAARKSAQEEAVQAYRSLLSTVSEYPA